MSVMEGVVKFNKQTALKACLGEDYSLYDFDYFERAENLIKCGYDYNDDNARCVQLPVIPMQSEEGPFSALKTMLNEILSVCNCIVVWKSFAEALSILLLLPGFRRVLFAKLRHFREALCKSRIAAEHITPAGCDFCPLESLNWKKGHVWQLSG